MHVCVCLGTVPVMCVGCVCHCSHAAFILYKCRCCETAAAETHSCCEIEHK